MRKKIGLSLLIISMFLISIMFSQTRSEIDNVDNQDLETNYTISSPILIEKDLDFGPDGYNFPGSGFAADPYLIQNLNITAPGTYGIKISDVSAAVHFEIRDCYILADDPIILNTILSPETVIINNTLIADFYSGDGIYVNNTDDLTIDDNYISECINGVYIENSNNLNIVNNHFNENIYAIQGYHFTGSLIEFNTFEKNRELYFGSSGNLDFFDNTFLNNDHGLRFSSVDFTVITDNIFIDNIGYAIKFLSGTDCKVYHNYFIRNGISFLSQVYDEAHLGGNEWDYGGVGNFWLDLGDKIYYPIDGDDSTFDYYPFYNSDSDSLNDYEEIILYNTNPYSEDSDSDDIPDDFEVYNGLDPLIDDASDDPDTDELTNIFEYYYGTIPLNPDSDGDLMPDGYEVFHALNPLVDDSSFDLDGDGFSNYQEYVLGLMPNKVDSDSDGMDDYWEHYNGLNPLINDAWEDPDDDKLNNFLEYIYACDPQDSDSDDDGHDDGWEILQGTNPNDPTDYPLTTYEPQPTETDTFPTEESTFFLIASLLALLIFTGFSLRKKRRETKKLEEILKLYFP